MSRRPDTISTRRRRRCLGQSSTDTAVSPRRVRIAGTAFWLKPGGRDASSVPRRAGRSIRTERRDSRGIRLSFWRCALRPRPRRRRPGPPRPVSLLHAGTFGPPEISGARDAWRHLPSGHGCAVRQPPPYALDRPDFPPELPGAAPRLLSHWGYSRPHRPSFPYPRPPSH